MNKNLLYLIPATIVCGIAMYVTKKQEESFDEMRERLNDEVTKSADDLFEESNKALQELSNSIDDFGKRIKADSVRIQDRITRLNKEKAETKSKLLEYVNKESAE